MYYDCHCHTDNSHDCQIGMEDFCKSAINKCISGISFTDHADVLYWEEERVPEIIDRSFSQALEMKKKYSGKIEVFSGIEIGGGHHDFELSQAMVKKYPFDIVLGSMHELSDKRGFSTTDFSSQSIEYLEDMVKRYFEEMYEMVNLCDFDVLTHMTYPIRYINGKYNRGIDISKYELIIKNILKTVCKREIALEVNTSGTVTRWDELIPSEEILKLYRQLGGRLVTLGSDAHKPTNVAAGFDRALVLLKTCGFNEYFYYSERTAKPVLID